MRRLHLILLFLLGGALLPLSAQNNESEIDDTCYELMQQAERTAGTDAFRAVNDQLLAAALEAGDRKAETIYYVEELRHLTRLPSSPENDVLVDAAFEKLKSVATQTGYSQYFFYAYSVAQTYYHNAGKVEKTYSLLREMQEKAIEQNDVYGLWSSEVYLSSLYLAVNDVISAKPHLRHALELYETSDNPTLRRQSVSRLYCQLAVTYPVTTDSVRICVEKAWQTAQIHLDTLRCNFRQACIDVLRGEYASYRKCRDYYLADPQWRQVSTSGIEFFGLVDAALEGRIEGRLDEVANLRSLREARVIANLCERLGYKDFAFELEKRLFNRMERLLASVDNSRLSELDATMGNVSLSAQVAEKSRQLAQTTMWIAILLTLLLLTALGFSWIHIRHLQKTNERVRLADAAKTRFVQNMSHEVRTPLNAIVGFSQLLALPDGSFPEEEKEEFSGHIINNTKMLTMLLDDILNASAMDSGNYQISFEDSEVNFISQAAISSAEHRLQPGVRMYYAPEFEGPFHFRTDPRRVQQILINLLTNACKHTAQGEIRLSVSLTEHPGEVTFAVSDTGSGVPADQAEAIFERFTKLNDFVQGTGLGLSICRDIADRMGGRVYLDTTYAAPGARFVFVLPVDPPDPMTINQSNQ